MTPFVICIAGFKVQVCCIYESTRIFLKDYLCEGVHDFSVSVEQGDIDYEREKAVSTSDVNFSDEYLETLALYRKICCELLYRDTLLFHGSAVEVDGEAYLFTAKSGTGKSTHTALWCKEFGGRATIINDDKPLLRITDGDVLVCGSAWNGKHRRGTNKTVKLKAICILERDVTNHICQTDPKDALAVLVQQSFRTGTADGRLKQLELLDKIVQKVKLYRLGCNMDLEAARVSYNGMND